MNEKGGKIYSPHCLADSQAEVFPLPHHPSPPTPPAFWYVVLVCFWRFPLKFQPTAWVGSPRGNERREFSGRLSYTSARMQETG